jgi:hypothetical protein
MRYVKRNTYALNVEGSYRVTWRSGSANCSAIVSEDTHAGRVPQQLLKSPFTTMDWPIDAMSTALRAVERARLVAERYSRAPGARCAQEMPSRDV